MCNITNIKTNRRIGYKVLAYDNNKFYSTFTGQEMKVGKVEEPPFRCKKLSDYWNTDLDYNLKTCGFYNHNFAGKTSAFIDKEEAIYLLNNINKEMFKFTAILVKITFGSITYKGTYHNIPVICSDTIKSIEIIKTE